MTERAKQIELMLNIVREGCDNCRSNPNGSVFVCDKCQCSMLYDAGYRKINDGDVVITVKGEMRQRGALARLVNFVTNRARKTVATTMFKDVLALLSYAEKVGMRGAVLRVHVKDIAERNGANIDGYNL